MSEKLNFLKMPKWLENLLVSLFLTNSSSGGVQQRDWSPSDQERMANGEAPQGAPEHPNI